MALSCRSGADLDPINLIIPLDPETAARNRRANARYWSESTLIGPRDWPIDLVGGGDFQRELERVRKAHKSKSKSKQEDMP